jgi:CO/xanthine dehydrogenase FAD-binding subunit
LELSPDLMTELVPIDDVRATAAYRHDAAASLVRSTLVAAMSSQA